MADAWDSRSAAEEVDRLCARLAGAADGYDDIGRARAEAHLRHALARAPRRRGRAAMIAAVSLAVAASASILVHRHRAAAPGPSALTLRPYLVMPVGQARPAAAPNVPDASRIDVPAGWLVRAALEGGISLGVIGPARLTVAGGARDPELRLEGGRMLVDVTPGRGTHLRVVTAGVDLTVVGTLFSVDDAEVSVRHGRVRVRARTEAAAGDAAVTEIVGGQRWRVSSRALDALDADTAAALEEHHGAPPPPAMVSVSVTGQPTGAEVRLDGRRLATTPAWLRVPAGAELDIGAPGHHPAKLVVPEVAATLAYHLAAIDVARAVPPAAPPEVPAAPVEAPPTPAAPAPPRHATLERSRRALPRGADDSPAAPVEAPPAPAALYQRADRALAAGDHEGARAALLAIVRDRGGDTVADPARIDLATLALQAGDLESARSHLDDLQGDAVAEPAARLRCRIAVAAHEPGAVDCLASFRQRFPRSPHAVDALLEEGVLRADRGDCAHAAPLLGAALSRGLPLARRAAARERLGRCDATR